MAGLLKFIGCCTAGGTVRVGEGCQNQAGSRGDPCGAVFTVTTLVLALIRACLCRTEKAGIKGLTNIGDGGGGEGGDGWWVSHLCY